MWPDRTKMSYEKIFANNVKAFREARGLSQKELAEEILGYPEEMIRQVEEGNPPNCSIDFYVCLAKQFGVTVDALLTNRYLVPQKRQKGLTVKVKVRRRVPAKIEKVSRQKTAQQAWEEFKRHYMPVKLTPSYYGKDCQGNGEHEIECQCDACDHFLTCFPIKHIDLDREKPAHIPQEQWDRMKQVFDEIYEDESAE